MPVSTLLFQSLPVEVIYKDSHSTSVAPVWTALRCLEDLDGPLEEDVITFIEDEELDEGKFRQSCLSRSYWTGSAWHDDWMIPSKNGVPQEVVKEVERLLHARQVNNPSPDKEPTVRFTVDLPRSLHKRLKLAALNRDEPMTDLAREVLAEWLEASS